MKVILDIGANDGFDGLVLSILNPDKKVFAFEANPDLKSIIIKNKKILEKIFDVKIKNYSLINKAVSNKNKKLPFYILKNSASSSLLKPKKVLNLYWRNHIDKSIKGHSTDIKIKKKIIVDSVRLKDFCKSKKITEINYIHCDTQGTDLDVFKSLGNLNHLIFKGVLETIQNPKLSLYHRSFYTKDIKKFFKKFDFTILDIKEFHRNNPYRDMYFINYKFSGDKNINLPSLRERRFFNRILNKKLKFKDWFYMKIIKLFL
tara:strand:- start:339 stop:1118 length:780 start_codon:yes stop_codon:yes gene_type:complete